MGVAVLQPQNCLPPSPSRKPLLSPPPPKMKLPHPKPSRTPRSNPSRQKRAHNGSNQIRPEPSVSDAKPQPNNKLVMGQVKILKRGELLTESAPDQEVTETVKESLTSTEQPLTERVGGLYAGSSTCVASPPPSSVPVPHFLTKKIAAVSDATNELRKMLRLEFS